jgi:hypothetical protein
MTYLRFKFKKAKNNLTFFSPKIRLFTRRTDSALSLKSTFDSCIAIKLILFYENIFTILSIPQIFSNKNQDIDDISKRQNFFL